MGVIKRPKFQPVYPIDGNGVSECVETVIEILLSL